jgi:SpoVK/Ycf46/Vps4 family AAA+-type ATPase
MPKRFPIRLPNHSQRVNILTLASIHNTISPSADTDVTQMLAKTNLSPNFSIDALAARTDGLSGSDLRETCRNAAMSPVRELMRSKGASGKEGLEAAKKDVSPRRSARDRTKKSLICRRVSRSDRWKCLISSCTTLMPMRMSSRAGDRSRRRGTASSWTRAQFGKGPDASAVHLYICTSFSTLSAPSSIYIHSSNYIIPPGSPFTTSTIHNFLST